MTHSNFIVGTSSIGKTRKLLEFVREQNAVVVCRNPSGMARKAQAYGIFGLSFIGYDEVISSNHIYDGEVYIGEKFVIDEVADFLSDFFGGPCIGFTQTEEE